MKPILSLFQKWLIPRVCLVNSDFAKKVLFLLTQVFLRMKSSRFIYEIQKQFVYPLNLVSKIGPVSRANNSKDKARYNVRLEFCPIRSLNNFSLGESETFTVNTDSSILTSVVLGNVWTKDGFIQNVSLNRETIAFEVEDNISLRLPGSLYSCFNIYYSEERIKAVSQSFIKQGIPITESALYSFCLKFPYHGINSVKDVDFVIIPCAELARYLFFKMSTLPSLILNGQVNVTNECRRFRIERGIREMVGKLIVVTDKKYDACEENLFVEILRKDPIERSYNIISDYLNEKFCLSEKKAAEIKTYLPSTHRRIYACGINVNYNGKTYFYVNQIYSIDYKPDFSNWIIVVDQDTRSAPSPEGGELKGYEHSKLTLEKDGGGERTISTEKEGAPKSVVSQVDFYVESVDFFGCNSIPQILHAPKEKQLDQYHGKTETIRSDSKELTTNPNRDGDSTALVVKVNSSGEKNEESISYDETSLFRVLLSINGRIIKESELKVEFFNIEKKCFDDSIIINKKMEKEAKNLIAKISHGKREVVIIDFSDIATKRIVSVHNQKYYGISTTAILEYIALINRIKIIPLKKRTTSNLNPALKWIVWERLNVEALNENELDAKLIRLVVPAYNVE